MEEELIEAVRSEQCLYDVKHPDYIKIKLKDSLWKRIAEARNLKDGNEAKKVWEKLRNNHRDALRRQKNLKPKSGSGAINIKSWRFQDQMTFLVPYMTNRLHNTNVSEEIQVDEPSQAHSDNQEIDIQESLVDHQELQTNNEEINQSSEPLPIPTGQIHKRKRRKGNTFINRSIEEHQERVNNRQRERERLASNTANDFTISNVKNDPLFHFFISMYETTKRLSPLSQHTIKTGIFSLVSREESKHLIQYSPRPECSATQTSAEESCYSSYTPSPVQPQLNEESLPVETQTAHQIQIISQKNQNFNYDLLNL